MGRGALQLSLFTFAEHHHPRFPLVVSNLPFAFSLQQSFLTSLLPFSSSTFLISVLSIWRHIVYDYSYLPKCSPKSKATSTSSSNKTFPIHNLTKLSQLTRPHQSLSITYIRFIWFNYNEPSSNHSVNVTTSLTSVLFEVIKII